METFLVLPFRVCVDFGAMAMKGYARLPRAPRLEPQHQMVLRQIQDIGCGVYNPSLEMQSLYSIAPPN